MSAEPVGLGGRVAIVTGALGGLGQVWSGALAGAGMTVVGVDLTPGAVDDPVAVHAADVTDRWALERVRDEVVAEHGVPWGLVNAAGIDAPPSSAGRTWREEDAPLEDFRRTVDVNLAGTVNAIQVFGASMRDSGGGSIVNIASLYASIAPDPSLYDHLGLEPPFLKPPAYGASKAGVVNLTRYFARLWGPHGVRVNALSPGGVLADQDDEFVRKYSGRVPLGRLADPSDLVGPLLFLLSDASRYVTGHELRVDGGLTA
jgi:NAD(P)-dependent dehydrogenase (short-subunit alcohol dehydrogenase family)